MIGSSSRTSFTLAIVGASVAVGFWQATALAAPEATWDQARVTEIAKKLAKTVDTLYDQEYKAPENMGEGDTNQDFMDELRRLQDETRHLASSLEKGAVAKHTQGSVEQIKELNDDLTEERERMEMESPVSDPLDAVESLIGQLLPYYGLKSGD